MKQYIVECPCNNYPTRTFWNTEEKAREVLESLSGLGCGSNCNAKSHKLIEIEIDTPNPEGVQYHDKEKGYRKDLVR